MVDVWESEDGFRRFDVATIVVIHGNPPPMSQFQGLVNKTQ